MEICSDTNTEIRYISIDFFWADACIDLVWLSHVFLNICSWFRLKRWNNLIAEEEKKHTWSHTIIYTRPFKKKKRRRSKSIHTYIMGREREDHRNVVPQFFKRMQAMVQIFTQIFISWHFFSIVVHIPFLWKSAPSIRLVLRHPVFMTILALLSLTYQLHYECRFCCT